jgi:hypothetical protein
LQIGKSRLDGKGFAVSCKVVEANVGVTTTSVKAPDVSPGMDVHSETLSLSLSGISRMPEIICEKLSGNSGRHSAQCEKFMGSSGFPFFLIPKIWVLGFSSQLLNSLISLQLQIGEIRPSSVV